MRRIVIGTRGSKLALWQANHVADLIHAACPEVVVTVEVIKTKGDRILDVALSKIGDKGLFTKELEQALFDKRVDICVHSLKDVPTVLPEGLTLAGCLARADARDALVASPGTTFAALKPGCRVGTGSLRRLSQLRALRDDLEYVEVRGNLDTRIGKVKSGALDAIVLACAGLDRMGWGSEIAERFSVEDVVPAVGQGAIGMELRAGDERVAEVCARIGSPQTDLCVAAERRVMHELDGGCQVPLGAYARFIGPSLVLDAFVGCLDGTRILKSRVEVALASPPVASLSAAASIAQNEEMLKASSPFGAMVIARSLAHQAVEELERQGARSVLDEVRAAGDERLLV